LRAFAQEEIVRVDVRGCEAHRSGWQCAAGGGCCR
jgi:hypothetical protein